MSKSFLILNALLLCVFSGQSFSLPLFDSENFLYDVGENGALMRGKLNAYLGLYYLRVNGVNYIGDIDHLSPDGREVRSAPFIEQGSGLEVKRHFYVSKTQNFARFSEILHNPTDIPITVDVEIYGKLGAKSHTTALVDQEHFLITGDVSGIIPVFLLHYHSQVNHPVTATHTLNNNQLSWVYSEITIPAQSEARLIYFVAQTTDVNVAKQVATNIYINPTALYENIDESAQLLNFEPQQPISREDEEVSDLSHAPFLKLGELRRGTLEEKDFWSFKRMATPADAYALNLKADETVTIRMSARFNAYLYLFQDMKAETVVAANDDREFKTTHAEIVFTAIEDGTYYIEATAHNRRERGEYTLEIISGAVNEPPTAYPFDFTGKNLISPATVTLTDFNTDKEGDIVERCWHFDDGSDVTCDINNNTVTHTYTEAGQYNVGLTLRDNDGAYSYHNEQISIASPPEGIVLRLSNIVSKELMPSDGYSQIRFYAFADRYRISSITAGQELVIDMISDDFDSYLYLTDRFNQPLAQDNNSGGSTHARLRYTPLHDDDLWIEATSVKDNTQGKYHLSMKLAENEVPVEIPIAFSPALNNPLQYQFIARLPNSFKATSLHWDFGDKTETVKTNKSILSHTYTQRGEMTVTVTAINDKNQRFTGSQRVIVNNKITAPKASFTAKPLFGEKPLRVFFTNDSVPNSQDDALNYVWHFGDGNLSSDTNPAHSFTKAGTYYITLEVFSRQERASYTVPVTVIDHDDTALPITGKVRELPQVLMAGFDPILIDLLDTHVKIFALVRAGKTPVKTVRFIKNGSDFEYLMQQVATLANGEQYYETVFNFEQGTFPIGTLGTLFGEKKGQFRIQAIDQAGQFHAFPNLEIGNNPPLNFVPQSLNIGSLHQKGIHRRQPQVLAAGFDPILVHKNDDAPVLVNASDAEFMIKAIVREGLFPIQSVTLKQNKGTLNFPMHLQETLPNGDELYVVNYPYPSESFKKGTLGHLFGIEPTQFTVTVEDFAQETHRFPEVVIGDFPQR